MWCFCKQFKSNYKLITASTRSSADVESLQVHTHLDKLASVPVKLVGFTELSVTIVAVTDLALRVFDTCHKP
jgi:hypothetical protein